MPLRYEPHITRAYALANPAWWFVFGDNMARSGYGGLARELRSLPNSIGVRTKRLPSTETGAYFSDSEYDHWRGFISIDLALVEAKLKALCTVVWPRKGLGRGLSQMHVKCPRLLAYLESEEDRFGRVYGNTNYNQEVLR